MGAGIVLWLITITGVLVEIEANIIAFSVALSGFAFLSFGIFIIPQLKLHGYLKEFKYSLVDEFSFILSRLEYLYFESLVNPRMIESLGLDWKSRDDLMRDIEFIKAMIEETKSYGTWSYDFPEVMKMVIVGLSTTIPLILSFF
ncbi:MAG: hypothetical protein ACTSVI_00470 [Promethearchaeota archaeon]